MEDNLILFLNGRWPKWKTTSTSTFFKRKNYLFFFQMEDNLNFFLIEYNLDFFQMEDDLNFFQMKDGLKKMTSISICIWKTTSKEKEKITFALI
jgi:hypothetical protein